MFDQYHTFWRRVGAAVIDSIVLNVLFFACFIVLAIAVTTNLTPLAVAAIVPASVMHLVYPITMHRMYGATVGKTVANIRVVDATTEESITWLQAVRRELLPIASTLIAFSLAFILGDEPDDGRYDRAMVALRFATFGWFLAELITMMSNPRRRSLHDYLAGTVVIKSQRVRPDYQASPPARREFPRPRREPDPSAGSAREG